MQVLFVPLSPTQVYSYSPHFSALLLAIPTLFYKEPAHRPLKKMKQAGSLLIQAEELSQPRGCPGSAPTCVTLSAASLYKVGPLRTGTGVSSWPQEAEMAADILTAVGHWKADDNSG